MDRQTLIEAAREFCEPQLIYPLNQKIFRENTWIRNMMADFAAKMVDKAVAAERRRIAEMVREIVSERNADVLAKAELMADEFEQPSPDTPESGVEDFRDRLKQASRLSADDSNVTINTEG